MNRRWLAPLLMLLVVIALALVAVYRPGQAPAPALPALTELKPDTVQTIRLERPEGEAIRLRRGEDGWRMVEPLSARANGFRIDNLLGITGAESNTSFPAAGAELAEYGLDRPRATLWLDDHAIRFGAKHAIEFKRYVLYRDQVHLIGDSYQRHVTAPYQDYLSTELYSGDRTPSLIELPGRTLRLTEKGWQVEPEEDGLGADRINRFVDNWRFARALSVDRHDGKQAKKKVRLTFGNGDDQQTLVLDIIDREPDLVLYRPDEGLAYRFTGEMGERLLTLEPEAEAEENKTSDSPAAPAAE